MIETRRLSPDEMTALQQKAARGDAMPDDLQNAAERSLFIALRGLFYQHRVGIIDREQAKKEKQQILQDYNQAVLGEQCREKSVKLWAALPVGIYKDCTCPKCKEVFEIIYNVRHK